LKNRSEVSEILYGSRIDYIKYVYEILFIAATAQMETLKTEFMCDSLNFVVSQMILSVSLALLLISPCMSKNNAYHMVLLREDFFEVCHPVVFIL